MIDIGTTIPANSTDLRLSKAAAGASNESSSVAPAEPVFSHFNRGESHAQAGAAAASLAAPALFSKPALPGVCDASQRMQLLCCSSCGLGFAIPAAMYFQRLSNRRRVSCPGCELSLKLPDPLASNDDLAKYNAALIGELESLRLRVRAFERQSDLSAGRNCVPADVSTAELPSPAAASTVVF